MHNKDYDSQRNNILLKQECSYGQWHCLQPIKAVTEPDSSYHATLKIHVQTLQIKVYTDIWKLLIQIYDYTALLATQKVRAFFPQKVQTFHQDEYYFFYSTCWLWSTVQMSHWLCILCIDCALTVINCADESLTVHTSHWLCILCIDCAMTGINCAQLRTWVRKLCRSYAAILSSKIRFSERYISQ